MTRIHNAVHPHLNTPRSQTKAAVSKLTSFGDPTQRLTVHEGVIHIAGVATNNGKARSGWKLNIEGHAIEVKLSRGETPKQTATAIARALPSDFAGAIEVQVPQRRPGGPIVEWARDRLPVTLTVTHKSSHA